MEKGKKIVAEFELPEAIVQHIQSFLERKEAAQTTILSKSWYGAWLTRPNLDFDEMDFISFVDGRFESRFSEFVNSSVQRYENLNLKIESLRLKLAATDAFYGVAKDFSYSLAHELILKAIKMGVIDLDFKNFYQHRVFAFPNEVFGSENVVRLSAVGCKIDLGEEGKVSCSRLESLSLENVYLKGDIIWNILLSCPLIEKLSLSHCRVSDFNVVTFENSRRLVWSPFVEFGKLNVGSVVDELSILHVFHKLKCLFLSWIDVDASFFDDLSSKFPCLKDLRIYNCGGFRKINICSPSLEFIEFTQDRMLTAKLDVPRVNRFSFTGANFPALLFTTARNNWKSDISIIRCSPPSTLWFFKLNNLLMSLSQSKVSLSFKIRSDKNFYCAGNLHGLPKPEVENLTIDVPYSVCHILFDCLFRCCRPIYVYQNWFRKSAVEMRNHDFMEFVYKRVIQQVSSNCSIVNQSMSGECILEEVDVEYFDEAVSVWRPRTLEALTSPGADEQGIRLHLRWGR